MTASATLANYDGSTYTGALWCKSGMYWGEFDPLTVACRCGPTR
jgi:hypothetical protein